MHAGYFTPEALLQRACRLTGLQDFGSDVDSQGFSLLLAALERSTALSENGRQEAAQEIVDTLVSRLVTEHARKTYPVYLSIAISRPVIITGIPRSGTTALHRLMSLDPQFQGIEQWLARRPKPRPPRSNWADDPDYAEAARVISAMEAATPEAMAAHGLAAGEVDESIFVLKQNFANNIFSSQWTIPAYDAWYRSCDETASYQRLADVMRIIGLHTPERRWLLKNPTDSFALEAVLNVFPDAMIVQTHRDPVEAIPSVASLLLHARRKYEGSEVCARCLILREIDFWAQAMERSAKARERVPGQVFDVEFAMFTADQLGMVRKIYRHFGLELSNTAEAAMQEWLAANPRQVSAGRLGQTAEDYGASTHEITKRYYAYRAWRGYAM
jgi:hypothetical protein